MGTSDIQFCSLCVEDDVNSEAITWCTECDTFLCLDCDKHHSRNKSSKQHKTLPSNDYNKLPDFILKTGNRCPDHDQRYELYCPNHSAACCIECFTVKHQNCKDLKRLPDIMKDAKSSISMTRLEQDLKDTNENYEDVIKYLKGRLSTILNQKTTKIEEIHRMRKSLKQHLDKLEHRMVEELDEEHNKLEIQTKKVINQVEIKRSRVKNYLEDLTKMKNFATELQTFIGIQEMENMATEEVRYLQKLLESGDLDELNIEVNISSDVKSAVQKLICFGSVSVSLVPCNLELKKKVECQVPISVPTVKTINDIHPVLKQKITLPKNVRNIISCLVLPNGHMLFVDYETKQLIQCDHKGHDIETVMSFRDSPYHVCFIKDNTVAVTLPYCNSILKIDLVSKEITITIQRNEGFRCFGIDSSDEKIIILEEQGSHNYAVFLDLAGNELRFIKVDSLFLKYVAVVRNKLYSTDWKNNKVICMQDNADALWVNASKDLKQPVGISVDNNKFVYVACEENNNIIIISPDGLTSRILLSEVDGIKGPTDICFDRETQTLLVSHRKDGSAFVFQI